MAQIRDIQLEMGWQQDQNAFAQVRFSVEFSESEQRRNMQYGMYVGIFANDERAHNAEFDTNGAYQTYMMPAVPPFGFQHDGMDVRNDENYYNRMRQAGLVCWVAKESLQPGNTRTHYINRKSAFDVSRWPNNKQGFRAMVWVVPEISQGQGWSKPQRTNGNGMMNSNYQPTQFAM